MRAKSISDLWNQKCSFCIEVKVLRILKLNQRIFKLVITDGELTASCLVTKDIVSQVCKKNSLNQLKTMCVLDILEYDVIQREGEKVIVIKDFSVVDRQQVSREQSVGNNRKSVFEETQSLKLQIKQGIDQIMQVRENLENRIVQVEKKIQSVLDILTTQLKL